LRIVVAWWYDTAPKSPLLSISSTVVDTFRPPACTLSIQSRSIRRHRAWAC
jgi:hypothetical protein